MLSFKNCNIYLNNKKIIKSNLTIKNGKFYSYTSQDGSITLDDKYIIVPGFIEQHMHGAMGCDVMDGNENSIHKIAKSLTQDGVTSWLPTTISLSKKEIKKVLKVVSSTKTKDNEAKIQGINLEGPFLSIGHKGVHESKYIKKPNIKDLDEFVKASNNKIRITTVAIERANKQFFDYCKKHNVVISVGHTDANGFDLKKAIKLGLACSTHTYNAMDKSITGNSIINAISKSNIYREIILDLYHVTKEQALFLFKNKVNKIIIITDSMSGRYMPNGIYYLGGQKVFVKDGHATLEDGKKAGSVLCLSQGLKNVKQICKLSIEQTIDMVSKNPAKNFGLKNVGCIKKGNDADFVIIDKNFNVYQTYINGKLVFDSTNK